MRNQHELHEVERRCTEEDPPACTAGCPLAVDVRAFNLAMAAKNFKKAWKLLEKSMPLPGITIRLCEAPCEEFCLRGGFGGSVAVSRLEKLCLEHAPASGRILPLPPRNIRVRCLGGGPSSLTCAWELARKGYSVEVVTSGDQARDIPLFRSLPAGVVDAELARLEKLKVLFRSSEPLTDEDLSGGDAAALFIDQDDISPSLSVDLSCDPETRQCAEPHIFTGGGHRKNPVISALSDGRQAAVSIDRFLQNASLTTGRIPIRNGATGLSPDLSGVTPLPPVEPRGEHFTDEEGAEEAARCLNCHCLRCVRACVYLQEYGDFPRKHARAIFNNFSIYQGVHGAYSLINSCALCGQCEEICPTDFSMADICLDARRRLVDDGDIPPSAHAFALAEMRHACEETALLRHAPGSDRSTAIFFPGCQLAAIRPRQVWALYHHLLKSNSETGIWLDCCGAPAHWAGRRDEAKSIHDRLRSRQQELGRPQIITACASCLQQFRDAGDFEVDSLWNLLAESDIPLTKTAMPLALSDPCTARHDEKTRASVRDLLSRGDQQLTPLAASGSTTECCGFGGLMENANPQLARKVVTARVAQSEQPFLTWCAMCRDQLAKTGHPVYHLLDLLFPAEAIDPATAPATISERRFNRQELKNRLLTELYAEEPTADKPWSSLLLEITPEVARELDSRRILEDDLRQTLAAAEESGAFFVHDDERRRASARFGEVTFWVEYRVDSARSTYTILRAWSHRMKLNRKGQDGA